MVAGTRLFRLITVMTTAGLLISAASYARTARPGPFWRLSAAPVSAPALSPSAAAAPSPERESPVEQPPAVGQVPAVEQVPGPAQAKVRLARIPILMYHEIGDKPNDNYIRQSDFAAQMQWLYEHGYTGVTLGAVYRHLYEGEPLPPKPVAITFDDGYRTFYTIVVPILQQYRFAATNFVITSLVGRTEHMTWEQVVALPQMGMEVGSHTVNHPDLRMLSGDRLQREMTESRRLLEEWTGVTVDSLAYPAGRYNDATLAAAKAAGYRMAVTTANGPGMPEQDPLLLSRTRITRLDSLASYARKVQGAAGY